MSAQTSAQAARAAMGVRIPAGTCRGRENGGRASTGSRKYARFRTYLRSPVLGVGLELGDRDLGPARGGALGRPHEDPAVLVGPVAEPDPAVLGDVELC